MTTPPKPGPATADVPTTPPKPGPATTAAPTTPAQPGPATADVPTTPPKPGPATTAAPTSPAKPGLGTAYGLTSPAETAQFYDGWAPAYDDELAQHGYVTPQRCAQALARHAPDPAAPVADLGCGTGLSGAALRAAGFTCLDGYDISAQMLARAATRGLYRALALCDLSHPLPFAPGAYAHAAAIGCISPGYMDAHAIDRLLLALPPGGCLVLSLNDRSMADPRFPARVEALVAAGHATLAERQHGDHIPGTGLMATVFVLRRS